MNNILLHASSSVAWPQGVTFFHEWGEDHYHNQEEFNLDHNPHDNGLWVADNVTLISVGIDIGSSGTQIVFSRITLQRRGEALSSRYFVVAREQIYQSPVSLTPYAGGLLIDKAALGTIIDDAYNQAHIQPSDVDTGAVILTGEALRRDNAHNIADILASHGGDFVCTMAGHHIEATLAAYGSGAAWESNEHAKRVLNIDIGGGTTKYAVIEGGRVQKTGALYVGGRLHVFDDEQRLIRCEPVGEIIAKAAGFDWCLGKIVPREEKAAVAAWMANSIIAAVTGGLTAENISQLWLTEPINIDGVQAITFSGGVSEYIYAREHQDFGDMGKSVGIEIGRKMLSGSLPWDILPAGAGIRSTALGLSEYAIQLSGNTIFVPSPELVLPRRNMRVIRSDYAFPDNVDPNILMKSITDSLTRNDSASDATDYVLAFSWAGPPRYERIANFAKALILALPKILHSTSPCYIVMDGDIARTLGRILQYELHVKSPLLIIDGVNLSDFDHIDFGTLRIPSNTVPITIKSLLFSKDPRFDDGRDGNTIIKTDNSTNYQ